MPDASDRDVWCVNHSQPAIASRSYYRRITSWGYHNGYSVTTAKEHND